MQILLIVMVVLVMPRSMPIGYASGPDTFSGRAESLRKTIPVGTGKEAYSVIIDAGSTGALMGLGTRIEQHPGPGDAPHIRLVDNLWLTLGLPINIHHQRSCEHSTFTLAEFGHRVFWTYISHRTRCLCEASLGMVRPARGMMSWGV